MQTEARETYQKEIQAVQGKLQALHIVNVATDDRQHCYNGQLP